jgi:FkbM family methyltransferase
MTIQTKTIDGLHFSFVNEQEFASIYHDVFKVGDWRFAATTSSPRILDCGAHIGISVLYFKKLYPHAKIIAFEPNPDTFKLLELNVSQNRLHDVELVNAAIAHSSGSIDFYICEQTSDPLSWAWGNAGVKNTWNNLNRYQTVKVPSVTLSSYIDQPIDFLKLDVEGMEAMVLEEIEGRLHHIKDVRMEFHGSSTNEHNSIEDIFSVLSRNNFYCNTTQYNKLVQLNQITREDPYFLMLYANQHYSTLWWETHILRNINRLSKRLSGNRNPPRSNFS